MFKHKYVAVYSKLKNNRRGCEKENKEQKSLPYGEGLYSKLRLCLQLHACDCRTSEQVICCCVRTGTSHCSIVV